MLNVCQTMPFIFWYHVIFLQKEGGRMGVPLLLAGTIENWGLVRKDFLSESARADRMKSTFLGNCKIENVSKYETGERHTQS